jgi:hypothetical protein
LKSPAVVSRLASRADRPEATFLPDFPARLTAPHLLVDRARGAGHFADMKRTILIFVCSLMLTKTWKRTVYERIAII